MRLKEGKYYRTRSGYKVGPAVHEMPHARHGWNVPHACGPYYYYPDGRSCIGDIVGDKDDIVAEWVVESYPMFEPRDEHLAFDAADGDMNAALKLMERAFPGWKWVVSCDEATIWRGDRIYDGPTLLDAMIKAKESGNA